MKPSGLPLETSLKMRVRTVQVSGRVRPTDRPQKRALFMGWAMGDGRFRVVFQCYRALTPPVLLPPAISI